MNKLEKETGRPELLSAIKSSITDARYTVKKLSEVFTENIRPLRLEESKAVFEDLSQNILDLQCLMEFLSELKTGLSYFDSFGLSEDPISTHDAGFNLFMQMHGALESQDWILLSDLIEYELTPLLIKEDKWLGSLDDKLLEYNE